jgi:hypothetical protein
MKRTSRPDLATLIGMIDGGRIAELTDLELIAVVMMTDPERAREVLKTLTPSTGHTPTAEDVMNLRAKNELNFTVEKRQLDALAEFRRRYRARKGSTE